MPRITPNPLANPVWRFNCGCFRQRLPDRPNCDAFYKFSLAQAYVAEQ
jgi:hypothetical protein